MKKILSLIFITTLILIRPTITSAQVNVQDSLALVDLYNSTDGPHWKNHNNWLTTRPVEAWYGVAFVDNNQRVFDFELSDNNLKGNIPSSFGNLTGLGYLHLDHNQLSGSIPSSFDNLTQLQFLYLNNNQLSGGIPTALGHLTMLRYLYLNNNELNDTIPQGLSGYVNILDLSYNQLHGSIPARFSAADDATINLSHNLLTGKAPLYLNGVYNLNLSYNQLSGSIPNYAYNSFLNLSNNQFSDTIPYSIFSFFNEVVYLDHNQFTGSLPAQAIVNAQVLYTITLDHNQLSGSIPSDFGTLSNLRKLTLNDNQLTGGIPPSLGNLSTLTALALYNNKLTGSIPKELGRLDSLHYLFLSNNKLTGSIPDSLSNLKALYDIDLNSNQLTGSIPSSFGKLTQLRDLALNDNNLAGKIPSLLDSLKQLVSLKLQHNQLSGTVPSLNDLNLAQKISLRSNNFLFSGLERLTQKFGSKALYYDQASIPLHQHGSYLSVNAGGTLSNNTYTWYRYSDAFVSIKGDSSLQMILSGVYYVVVTNAVATGLTLYSDTIVYNNGLDKAVPASAIILYPNPSKSNATALFTATGKYSVQLTNLSGKTLQTKTGVATDGKNKADFDIRTYPQGMYIITIKDEKESRMVKLTKE